MEVLIRNDFNTLKSCILCYPCNLEQTGKNKANQQVNKELASVQYNNLVNHIAEHGVKVHFVPLNGGPSQVFTRDIGFIIDDILFISKMTSAIRESEINTLKEVAETYDLKPHIMENYVEGGDIIVHNDGVFIGQGNRTNEKAVEEIDAVLRKHNRSTKLVKVSYDVSKIHLDCVFNVLDEDTCIITSGVYNPEEVTKYFKKVIKVTDEDAKDLATNIVQISKDTHLCSSENFSRILQSHGYQVTYIDFSEIIKCNGSLGCCVLPMQRA
ncbi:hypothetical protein BHU72_01150 [Desulfuribacillus stibiiarsenatis]|uniref:N(G),N(G)-dimethylarginine dimethylaminohydrolase n=1 Tax=Desulfuribacillus stibiiarsenatis TaxID=1390249 RepID=A0A1E5LA01_9FIRM|nr:arginine deiminase family protein [Desulfuribacillus stibiiarsenatis]OEH86898.1 hypothetical protein BHU72_01150 [Desulfuribacillus stibiiarsenatis]